jgi:thiol-disulfide isomerase/thioredoxin
VASLFTHLRRHFMNASTSAFATVSKPPRAAVATAAALALLLVGACSKTEPSAAPVATAAKPIATKTDASVDHAATGIAWKHASNDAEVDAAFAEARGAAKPVFVYWGAKWCPPCNQVKATLFNRRDFIERSRAFVPVYVDGDSPGAQKLGARFHVSGYPTMVLFDPRGVELTRLPGEVDAERYTEVLTLGMNAQRPVKEVLAMALTANPSGRPSAGPSAAGRSSSADRRRYSAGLGLPLSPSDWRLLAFYSWETDQQLVPKNGLPALLGKLAAACPADQTETAMRLRLKALAATDEKALAKPSAATHSAVVALLADPVASRAHTDVVTSSAADITRALSAPGTPHRTELLAAFDAALKRFEADTTLSRADRMSALIAQVDLARIDEPKPRPNQPRGAMPALGEPLLADIRVQTARADREITDGYERQAVITAAAYLLDAAGLGAESDALLKANLAKSHSPYYLMSELAGNARHRGDTADALHWYEAAYATSEGPATRLQWGGSYVMALIDLAPADEGRIERTVQQLFAEAATRPDAFYERSGRSLQRVGSKLVGWNAGGAHRAVMQRLRKQLDAVCSALADDDGKRAACNGLLTPATTARAAKTTA